MTTRRSTSIRRTLKGALLRSEAEPATAPLVEQARGDGGSGGRLRRLTWSTPVHCSPHRRRMSRRNMSACSPNTDPILITTSLSLPWTPCWSSAIWRRVEEVIGGVLREPPRRWSCMTGCRIFARDSTRPGRRMHERENSEQDAGPNDQERGQPHAPSLASSARSSSSVSFPLGSHRT